MPDASNGEGLDSEWELLEEGQTDPFKNMVTKTDIKDLLNELKSFFQAEVHEMRKILADHISLRQKRDVGMAETRGDM
ncbi:hypothetical protein FKM82_008065 [Ascaphus truei]